MKFVVIFVQQKSNLAIKKQIRKIPLISSITVHFGSYRRSKNSIENVYFLYVNRKCNFHMSDFSSFYVDTWSTFHFLQLRLVSSQFSNCFSISLLTNIGNLQPKPFYLSQSAENDAQSIANNRLIIQRRGERSKSI